MALWEGRPRVTVRRRRLRLVARVHAVSAPTPRVRRERPVTLASLARDRPMAFRALFHRPPGLGPPFLERGTPERDLVGLLSQPWPDAAAEGRTWPQAAQEAVFRRLRGLARGEMPIGAPWGEDPAADELRRRLLHASEPRLGHMRWGRFLEWAGERLAAAPPGSLGPPLVRAGAAGLAAFGGYRFAFEAVAGHDPGRPDAEHFDVLSVLALRCALEDSFLPGLVEWLVPAGALRRRGALPRDPWAAALLALRAFGEQGNALGRVHLTAALMAADVRERVLTFVGREGASLLRRPWWSRVPAGSDAAFADTLAVVRAKAVTLGARSPWPRGWGGPNLAGLLRELEALTGSALELFLDDRLAVAAVQGAAGDVAGAAAQAAAAEVAPALSEARRALVEGLARAGRRVDPAALLTWGDWDRDAERLFRQMRATPDPSVELASPYWLLEGTRGVLMARLVGDGRRRAASAVRTVLERADLQAELKPFWILRGGEEDTQAVHRLARWAAAQHHAPVEERDWIRFIEGVCRAQEDERADG